MASTALATAAAVLGGLVYAAPVAADEPGDHPSDPWLRSLRISLGATAREDRCQVAQAVRYGGPEMKAFARDKLTGPDAALRKVVLDGRFGQLEQARQRDETDALAYGEAFTDRHKRLDEANKPYRDANLSGGRDYHAPEFGADIMAFTVRTQQSLYFNAWDNPTPRPGKTAFDRAEAVFDAFPTPEGDSWASSYKSHAGASLFGQNNSTSANDVATFLRFGGFATKEPDPDSAGFRAEVEYLKVAWAACDSQNPVDHYRVLTAPVVQAHAEWEAEYASQAAQHEAIAVAEMQASKAARTAADAMIETIRQAWQAEQILFWQKYWAANKDALDYPTTAQFATAKTDLLRTRFDSSKYASVAQASVSRAKTFSERVAEEQAEAWKIADGKKVPRGRGLMHAQQSVQVAKASYAAAQAAEKTALTAAKATEATASDSAALLALAKTQSHAMNTEFRKAAAQEAATQAKSAAAAAAVQAKEAADNATTARNAQTTAEKAERSAKASAAEAKAERGKAEREKANAAAERATAARERAQAAQAAQRADTERASAESARNATRSAGAVAAARRDDAERAEVRAYQARDAAVEAERDKNAIAARARALEAAAAAAEGTEAAVETRQAATAARAAANEASAAAGRARSAADDASAAAVSSRAAATRASGAAARSQASADRAWSAYRSTSAAAATASAAAAEAIDAAAAAASNAKKAQSEATIARAAAIRARTEATIAEHEAARTTMWSAKTAGYAFAASQAAIAARDAARAVIKAANTAISIGAPYQERDSSAAFAVLVGQTSKTMADQQAAAAEAKAKEAGKAAAAAEALADQAAGDAKIAAQAAAAAAAAADTVKALASVAAARAAAAEAATAAAAARTANRNAQKHDEQAGVDATHAQAAAKDAGAEAAAANHEATEAERDAASARASATAAEKDAASARTTATKAEKDATAADTAAKNAEATATEADAAATRAEEQARKRAADEYAAWVKAGAQNAGPDLPAKDEALLRELCGQTCIDEFRTAKNLAAADVINWIRQNGGEILIDLFGVDNVIECVSTGDLESCLWALVDVGSIAVSFLKAPAVANAISRVVNGIDTFYDEAKAGERTLERFRKMIEKAKKEKENPTPNPPCKKVLSATAAGASRASYTASSATDPCDWNLPEGVHEIPELSEWGIVGIRETHFAGGAKVDSSKGLFKRDITDLDLQDIFEEGMVDPAPFIKNKTGYFEKTFVYSKKSIGYSSQNSGGDLTARVTLVISAWGDVVNLIPKSPF